MNIPLSEAAKRRLGVVLPAALIAVTGMWVTFFLLAMWPLRVELHCDGAVAPDGLKVSYSNVFGHERRIAPAMNEARDGFTLSVADGVIANMAFEISSPGVRPTALVVGGHEFAGPEIGRALVLRDDGDGDGDGAVWRYCGPRSVFRDRFLVRFALAALVWIGIGAGLGRLAARRRLDWLAGIWLGGIFFLYVDGMNILNIGDYTWIAHDSLEHIGINFFINEPWHFPLGRIADYVYPGGTSMMSVQGYPFIYLVKLFRGFFPEGMLQFHGLWILMSFMLQGVFGVLLMRLVSRNTAVKIAGAALFVLMPSMLARATHGPQITQCSHWLLLWAAWLWLHRRGTWRTMAAWQCNIVLAMVINLYLLPFCFALYCAMLLDRLARKKLALWRAVALGVLAPALAAAVYLATADTVPNAATFRGFGWSSVNLNNFYNPHLWPLNERGCSAILKVIPIPVDNTESGSYLGFGILMLFLVGLVPIIRVLARGRFYRRYWPLLLAAAGVFALALSNRVILNETLLFTWPNIFGDYAEILRASGRLSWGIGYLLLFFALAVLVKSLRRRPKMALAVLLVAVAAQLYDLTPYHKMYRQLYRRDYGFNENARLSRLAAPYRHISASIPYHDPSHVNIRIFPFKLIPTAVLHGKTLNTGFYSRWSDDVIEIPLEMQRRLVEEGVYDPDTIYVLTREKALELPEELKRYVSIIDDELVVFTPGVEAEAALARWQPAFELELDFTTEAVSEEVAVKKSGFNHIVDNLGTWTVERVAEVEVTLPWPPPDALLAELEFTPYIAGSLTGQRLRVLCGGEPVGEFFVDRYGICRLEIPAALSAGREVLTLTLALPDAVSPGELGFSSDWRPHGIQLKRIGLTAVDRFY